jgi:S1-C subfamily serine protease
MIDMDTRQDLEASSASSRVSRWQTVLMALVLFASGIGIGWLVTGEEAPSFIDETPTTIAETVSGTAGTSGGVVNSVPSDGTVTTEPLIDSPVTDEPVADVAEALLPAIVQIELPFGGLGSGVVYHPDGRILTAAHVVEGVDEVRVRLSDGDRVPGIVLGADSGNDIAVIEVDRTGLPAAPLALDTEPRVGQMAVALGSPWGLDSTVTAGVISAVDRPIQTQNGFRAMLQTDAPINPGNSGGALADRHGRVIGINVSIFSASGANDGVGFAVPIDRAYRVAEALAGGEEFVPGFLGVVIQPSDDGAAGAVVSEVSPGTAAERAGIMVGDRIVSVDGTPIADPSDLGAQIRDRQAGDVVSVEVVRDGEEFVTEITLGAREPTTDS